MQQKWARKLAIMLSMQLLVFVAAIRAVNSAQQVSGTSAHSARAITVATDVLELTADTTTGLLQLWEKETGLLLQNIRIAWIGETSKHSPDSIVAGKKDNTIVLLGKPGKATLSLSANKLLLNNEASASICMEATVPNTRDAIPAILVDEQEADQHVLYTRLGMPPLPGIKAFFDRRQDVAVRVETKGKLSWKTIQGIPGGIQALTILAPTTAPTVTIEVIPHYVRDKLKVGFFAPIKTPSRWPTAPVVAMTWYGIQGWKGSPAQRKEWLYPNIDWVAKHLKPYVGDNLVFQLDDNYPFRDDKYMREISDYIRSRGLIPGVWFTPFAIAGPEVAKEHPDWFLHDAKGNFLAAFGGHNWGYRTKELGSRAYVLNVTNPEAVKHQYGMFWHKVSETWNYDFFKIDGQPQVIECYKRSVDGNGIAGYHQGLKIARQIVGPEKFINGCWGIPLAAIGYVNGSRTGPDTGNWPHAVSVILKWNFLNNICWWCDPDAAANLYAATVERARLNAQARVLTGQQFLTDDVWVKVPPEICRVWQLSFPTLNIVPVNLYPINNWHDYDVFDLKIETAGRVWDVVGLFNYDNQPVLKKLELARLRLPAARVHVYEFWKGQYLGTLDATEAIQRWLKPYEGEVFALVPVKERPVLLSTSRHVTQGAVDLVEIEWRQEGNRWIAQGKSRRLVAGDTYRLTFAPGNYRVEKARADCPVSVERNGSLEVVVIKPDGTDPVGWQVTFAPIAGGSLGLWPTSTVLQAGESPSATISLQNRGTMPVRFSVESPAKWLKIEPSTGTIPPWPSTREVKIEASQIPLLPGKTETVELVVRCDKLPAGAIKAQVLVVAPPPVNLARQARAKASSTWGAGYEANRINDGDPKTRWNSAPNDVNGCWIELVWPEPVEFDAVEIDECTTWGQRIQKWHLEAGTDTLQQVASGAQVGRNRLVRLDHTVRASKLRLTVDRATVTPTIYELKVYHLKKPDKQ